MSLEGAALVTLWVSERRVDDASFGTEALLHGTGWGLHKYNAPLVHNR